MVSAKQTAEQKLLKMIEMSSDDDGLSSGIGRGMSSGQGVALLAQRANKILILIAVLLTLLFFYEFKNGMAYNPAEVNLSNLTSGARNSQLTDGGVKTIQRVSYYLAGISSRNIFEPYSPKAVTAAVETTPQQDKVADRVRDLKLVGISWMDQVSTASVMIEDSAKEVTYFLQKDGRIDDIVVKTIYAESVELGYENEEIIITYDKSQM